VVYAKYVNLLGENINPTKNKTEAVLDASKEIIIEVNTEKTTLLYVNVSSLDCTTKL
jgi:hypothetical protein